MDEKQRELYVKGLRKAAEISTLGICLVADDDGNPKDEFGRGYIRASLDNASMILKHAEEAENTQEKA